MFHFSDVLPVPKMSHADAPARRDIVVFDAVALGRAVAALAVGLNRHELVVRTDAGLAVAAASRGRSGARR